MKESGRPWQAWQAETRRDDAEDAGGGHRPARLCNHSVPTARSFSPLLSLVHNARPHPPPPRPRRPPQPVQSASRHSPSPSPLPAMSAQNPVRSPRHAALFAVSHSTLAHRSGGSSSSSVMARLALSFMCCHCPDVLSQAPVARPPCFVPSPSVNSPRNT